MSESNYIINKEHIDFDELVKQVTDKVLEKLLTGIMSELNEEDEDECCCCCEKCKKNCPNRKEEYQQPTNPDLEILKELKLKVIRAIEVIDNLDSNDSTKALSANMGRVIKTNMQELIAQVYNNIVNNLKSDDANKFLSANMGLRLNEKITALEDKADGGGSINSNLPSGIITMWSGPVNQIPKGWALCDGQNGRPNLLDKFIKGTSMNHINPGKTGGNHQLSLSHDNIPLHSHSIVHTHIAKSHAHKNGHYHKIDISTEPNGTHTHYFLNDTLAWNACLYRNDNIISVAHNNSGDHIIGAAKKTVAVNNNYRFSQETRSSSAHTHHIYGNTEYAETPTEATIIEIEQFKGNSQATGKSIPFDNRPEYYEVAFIIKL